MGIKTLIISMHVMHKLMGIKTRHLKSRIGTKSQWDLQPMNVTFKTQDGNQNNNYSHARNA